MPTNFGQKSATGGRYVVQKVSISNLSLSIPVKGTTSQQAHIADAVTAHSIVVPGDAPADADALRDDITTNSIPAINFALNALGVKINAIYTALETLGLVAS